MTARRSRVRNDGNDDGVAELATTSSGSKVSDDVASKQSKQSKQKQKKSKACTQ